MIPSQVFLLIICAAVGLVDLKEHQRKDYGSKNNQRDYVLQVQNHDIQRLRPRHYVPKPKEYRRSDTGYTKLNDRESYPKLRERTPVEKRKDEFVEHPVKIRNRGYVPAEKRFPVERQSASSFSERKRRQEFLSYQEYLKQVEDEYYKKARQLGLHLRYGVPQKAKSYRQLRDYWAQQNLLSQYKTSEDRSKPNSEPDRPVKSNDNCRAKNCATGELRAPLFDEKPRLKLKVGQDLQTMQSKKESSLFTRPERTNKVRGVRQDAWNQASIQPEPALGFYDGGQQVEQRIQSIQNQFSNEQFSASLGQTYGSSLPPQQDSTYQNVATHSSSNIQQPQQYSPTVDQRFSTQSSSPYTNADYQTTSSYSTSNYKQSSSRPSSPLFSDSQNYGSNTQSSSAYPSITNQPQQQFPQQPQNYHESQASSPAFVANQNYPPSNQGFQNTLNTPQLPQQPQNYQPSVIQTSYQAPTSGISSYQSNDNYQPRGGMPYNFAWSVKDELSYNDYGHQETSDGNLVTGSYHVLLPDGRRQIVTYRVEGDSGFVADVRYEGTPQTQGNFGSVTSPSANPFQGSSDYRLGAGEQFGGSPVLGSVATNQYQGSGAPPNSEVYAGLPSLNPNQGALDQYRAGNQYEGSTNFGSKFEGSNPSPSSGLPAGIQTQTPAGSFDDLKSGYYSIPPADAYPSPGSGLLSGLASNSFGTQAAPDSTFQQNQGQDEGLYRFQRSKITSDKVPSKYSL